MTDHAFQQFLLWLSPQPERAARRYADMHTRLSRVFARARCDQPDDLADETIDRAVGKVERVSVGYQGDPEAYVMGIARRVMLEHARSRRRRSQRAWELAQMLRPSPLLADAEREQQHAILEHCLAELGADERTLILMYYAERGPARRRVLAGANRLSQVALRKRTQRIRDRLKRELSTRMPGQRTHVGVT